MVSMLAFSPCLYMICHQYLSIECVDDNKGVGEEDAGYYKLSF